MTGRMTGKVAFVTGAARGQGRSHAVKLAAEGADIIAIDICADIPTNGYPLASEADLAETARLVEALDRRVITAVADVRDLGRLRTVLTDAVAELGRLDAVVANAGIAPLGSDVPVQGYFDTVNVNYVGVMNTIEAALPHLPDGASIVCTGSTGALMPHGTSNPALGPGGSGYTVAKRSVGRMVHDLAGLLAPRRIRVNAIHPYNVNTDMLHSEPMYKAFRPDLEHPTREDAEQSFAHGSPMNLKWIEPEDVSAAVVFLAGDESRYVTGVQLKIDGAQMVLLSDSGMPG